MIVHLLDGTYELFRHFYAVPPHRSARTGEEVGATRGVVGSVLGMLEGGATHVAVATDHIIESFRNDLYAGYKTGAGIDPALRAQFNLLEDALRALGVTVFAMVEFEADDALAAAALVASHDPAVEQVQICTPDKDLAQCVRGAHVVQLDRRRAILRDEAGVIEKFGVPPASIPDLLALIGDAADGFPGIPRWGAKSAATVLAHYEHIEKIPLESPWEVAVRGAPALVASLRENYDDALLFKTLATLRTDIDVGTVSSWRWRGATAEFEEMCARLDAPELVVRAAKLGS